MASPVATVWAQFRLDMSDFASKIGTASSTLKSFANTQQRVLKQQNQGYDKASDMIKSFNRGLSDTVNITRGIVISQAFYAAVGAINDATSALWDFNKQLDYAHVTYSALFGDATLANDFMSVLQEHAIETIFNYQDLAGISKKLLAYGIEYENLMFIMEGLTNLGTMSGDSAALDRIALALGQIYTKGKLSAEEMRQLANAYVPITEIITEKFNLSEADLERVGDLNLPAEEVINAIVDYANDNFGSVGDAAMMTITGLEAKIVDTLKVMGSEMLKPVTTAYKSFLAYISNGLEGVREAFASGGMGGVFEYLIPDEGTQKTIRIFLANIKNLFNAVMSLGKAAGQVFGNFAQVFVAVFNAVVPAITAVTNAIAILVNAMASTSAGAAVLRIALVAVAGAFVLMRVQAMGALVVTVVTKAVNGLSKALAVLATIIAKHPILSLLAMLGIALVGVSVSSNKANNALSGLFDTLAGTGGSSSSDMLQKTEEEIDKANDALDQFNNRLEEGKDSASDLEDEIEGVGAAAKKTGSVLSFDEVFKLNDPDKGSSAGSGVDSGVLGDIENLVSGLDGLSDALIPEIPDFSEYFTGFSDSLLGGLSEELQSKIAAGGWGALIGGILGGLIGLAFGNPVLGAKIGTAVGALAGVIFDELEYAISNTGTGAVAGIAAAISKALAGAGAVGLGTLLKNAFANGGLKGAFSALAGAIKTTGAKSLLKGGVIGAAVGLFVDGLAHLLWNTLEEKFGVNAETAKIGQTIGSLIGTIIGGILGGPAGAIIGSAIGTFVGGLAGIFYDEVKKKFKETWTKIAEDNALAPSAADEAWIGSTIGTTIGSLTGKALGMALGPVGSMIGTLLGGALGHGIGASIGLLWDETLPKLQGWWDDTILGFSTWASETGLSLSTWWNDTKLGFSTWWDDTVGIFSDWDSINSETLSTWWADTKLSFSTWWNDTKLGFSDWKEDTSEKLSGWWDDTTQGFSDWTADVGKVFGDWFEETFGDVSAWVSDTWLSISGWVKGTYEDFVQWSDDVDKVVGGFALAVYKAIEGWAIDAGKAVGDWATQAGEDISTWCTNAVKDIGDWATQAGEDISTWCTNAVKAIGDWFTQAGEDISTWCTNAVKAIGDWATQAGEDISTWCTNAVKAIGDWFTQAGEDISTWCTNAVKDIGDWATDTGKDISDWTTDAGKAIGDWATDVGKSISDWYADTKLDVELWVIATQKIFTDWKTNTKKTVSGWATDVMKAWEKLWDPDAWASGWESLKTWFSDLWTDISSWFTNIGRAIDNWWDGLWSDKSASVNVNSSGGASLAGHATGGVFNREHIARFAEGNKAEAIIPLENASAMQPFVDAVSNGIVSSLAPIVAMTNGGSSNTLPPLYVGTLVADERGLRELYKKFEVIQVQENARRGRPVEVF